MIGTKQKKDLLEIFTRNYPQRWVQPNDAKIIIVLGTGKCGTTTFTHLLNLSSDVFAAHELAPRLWHLGDKVFYDNCRDTKWEEIYWAARRDVVSISNEHGLVFGEVNHRCSVFLPAMRRLFKNAKFVLLWRDFDETVISGSRWGWYSPQDKNREGRVWPCVNTEDCREASAWYWINLHRYLLRHIDGANVVGMPFSLIKERNIEGIQKTYDKLGVMVPEESIIKEVLDEKYNKARREFEVPKIWGHWDSEAKEITEQLKRIG